MQDRPLDDALEAGGGGGVNRLLDLQRIQFAVEIENDGVFEFTQIDAAGVHHLRSVAVVDQREQKMLERRIFMAAISGIFQRLMQGFFERFRE